ncbi:MAG: HD domain-containing protein [Treponema sp.]|nr:HD domain-containing protein [Treponema sp.]
MSQTVSLDTLQKDLTFKSDLLLDKNFVLLPVAVPVTDELKKALKEWDFKEFLCDEEMSLGGDMGIAQNSAPSFEEEESHQEIAEQISTSVKKVLEEVNASPEDNSEKNRLANVQKVYNEYVNYINSVYTHYATHKKINLEELSDTVKDLCVFIRENKRYVLRISPSVEARNKNFIVIHSMRSTVLAITIGLEIHLPLSKLIELGVTCILHEIGMLRLPPQLYLTDRMLSPSERAQITTHTVLGFNILKELNFPLSIQLGVLEHHEKENGMGYPRHLTGEKISSYAKIISVACSFEAITAPREYKTERTTFDAMVEMLKNQNQQYDPTVIKGLLYSLSLFPIGAYVYMHNGKIGLVTDVNPTNPMNPLIQIVNEKNRDGTPIIIQTDNGPNKIVRVLTKQEEQDVVKSLNKRNQIEDTAEALEESEKDKDRTKNFSFIDLSEFN